MTTDLPNRRRLTYSPHTNPLLEPAIVPTKKRKVRSTLQEKRLVDCDTGELVATSEVHQIQEVDTAHFVKIFAAGIRSTYDLTAAAYKTFMAILQIYEKQPLSNGYAEAVHLAFFDGMLSGEQVNLSDDTFNRGMRELLAKRFLAPRMPNIYWVNPALFFKGDRVLFVNEYRKRQITAPDYISLPYNEKQDGQNPSR